MTEKPDRKLVVLDCDELGQILTQTTYTAIINLIKSALEISWSKAAQ